MRHILVTSAAALLVSGGHAAAADFAFSEDVTGPSGELSLWAGATIPTNATDDGGLCDAGGPNVEEYCDNSLALGGYAGALVPLSSGAAFYGDLRFEWYQEQNTESSARDDHGALGVIGLHYISAGEDPWGVFGFAGGGHNHADSDSAGPIGGLGVEKAFGNFYLQAGGLVGLDGEDAEDTLEDLYFIGGGSTHQMGNGRIETSLMIGQGDFDEDVDDDEGDWGQIGVTYFAPIGDSGVEWFAGYRGDYLYVDKDVNTGERRDRVFHQTLAVGINIPLGGAKSPFKTPNFTVPVVNAGEME